VLVLVDEPQGSIFGGVIAAPAFQRIARFALQYYEVPPDAPKTLVAPGGAPARAATTPAPATATDAAVSTATTSVTSGTAGLTPLG